MGNLVTKQTISIPQLQNKFLTYIFDNDGQHDNSWGKTNCTVRHMT